MQYINPDSEPKVKFYVLVCILLFGLVVTDAALKLFGVSIVTFLIGMFCTLMVTMAYALRPMIWALRYYKPKEEDLAPDYYEGWPEQQKHRMERNATIALIGIFLCLVPTAIGMWNVLGGDYRNVWVMIGCITLVLAYYIPRMLRTKENSVRRQIGLPVK